MNVSQLNTDIYTSMCIISQDENLLFRAANFLKKLAAEKLNDGTLMTKEEFFAAIAESEKQVSEGKVEHINSHEELDNFLENK